MRESNEVFPSVWEALGEDFDETQKLKIRSVLMIGIRGQLDKAGLTQAQAAKKLSVSQPRISDLYRGKIDKFNLESLIEIAFKAGLQVDVTIRETT